MTVHFDTLEFVKTLTSAGVSAPHAEAMMRAHARSLDEVMTSEIATKGDLKVQSTELRSDMNELRADFDTFKTEMRADFDTFKSEMRADFNSLRSEMKADNAILRSELTSSFELQLRSLKYAATLSMGFLSLVMVLSRFIH